MEDELVSGQVVLLIQSDLEALAEMPDGHLDWVYVDTTHQHEQTVKELALLERKVKPGGVISGDDWQPDPAHKYHGVCRAVREFVDREKDAVLKVDEKTQQWVIEWKNSGRK
jgi:predicted O-methyltransferase YrrM